MGSNCQGFSGAVFDGKYIYYVPCTRTGTFLGVVLRYDTTATYTSTASYNSVDLVSSFNSNYSGFSGGVFDGKYVYFVPCNNNGYSGLIARCNTTQPFASTCFDSYDVAGNVNSVCKGFKGAVFDGKYIYYVPNYIGQVNLGGASRLIYVYH